MRVLGISPLDKDATVSFVEDGAVVFACAEERLTRRKLQDGFPRRALALGLEKTGWSVDSIDTVAYAFLSGDEEASLIHAAATNDREQIPLVAFERSSQLLRSLAAQDYSADWEKAIPGFTRRADEFVPAKSWWKRAVYRAASRSSWLDRACHRRFLNRWVKDAIRDHRRWSKELEAELSRLNLNHKLRRFQHHLTHAANAFYSSGFDDALCLVLDGYGSGCSGGIFQASNGEITCLHRFRFPYSLGIFFEQVTSGLGFRPSRHEGKIVGLAAYGNPKPIDQLLLSRFITGEGDIQIVGAQNALITRELSQRYAKRDIAAAYQKVLETVTQENVDYWLSKTGMKRVVMSGGVHANVKLNQRVLEVEGVEGVFVYPNMADGGCATGAAFLALDARSRHVQPITHAYLGPEYDQADILAAIDEQSLEYEQLGDEIELRVAEILADDGIVARFNGRMEYGPRALGNRSILYPAKDSRVNQWLNEQLGRTEFMPFAPAVLAESARLLFKGIDDRSSKAAEFMTITYDCTEEMIQHSPAAVHVDGTARPQLVTHNSNPSLHRILQEYQRLTGIPVLINTSFNMHEEPIVASPRDAVRAFLLGNLHYLAIGEFLVPHPHVKPVRDRPVGAAEQPSTGFLA